MDISGLHNQSSDVRGSNNEVLASIGYTVHQSASGQEDTFDVDARQAPSPDGLVVAHQNDDDSPTTLTGSVSMSPSAPFPIKSQPLTSTAHPTDEDDAKDSAASEREATPWLPSVLRIGPALGLAALGFAVLSTLASFAVLKASDGSPVSSWKYQPTVYLAVWTAISNKALAFAMIQGTVVTFWLRALRGTCLGQMHRDWSLGLHVWKAIVAGRHFNLLAFACICATFVVIDGPLLQSASSVVSEVPQSPVNLTVSICPQVPKYLTGSTIYNNDSPGSFADVTSEWYPVSSAYSESVPISGAVKGCSGTCSATVIAPALAVRNCSTLTRPYDYTTPFTPSEQRVFDRYNFPGIKRQAFTIFLVTRNGTTETLDLYVLRSDDQVMKTGVGNWTQTACTLAPASAEYSIIIDDDVISFREPPSSPKIVSLAHNTAITPETVEHYGLLQPGGLVRTTLTGLVAAATCHFGADEALVPLNNTRILGLVPLVQSWFPMKHMTNYVKWSEGIDRAPGWRDPTAEVMAGLNTLMFRTGVYAAEAFNGTYLRSLIDEGQPVHYVTLPTRNPLLGSEITADHLIFRSGQNVTGTPLTKVELFKSDFNFFAGAAAVQGITILMILFTFYGWWRLGRHVSFSPLEIASAFDAPLLSSVGSNLSGSRLVRKVGSREVQYGIKYDLKAENCSTYSKLVVGDPEEVHEPEGKQQLLRECFEFIERRIGALKKLCSGIRRRSAVERDTGV